MRSTGSVSRTRTPTPSTLFGYATLRSRRRWRWRCCERNTQHPGFNTVFAQAAEASLGRERAAARGSGFDRASAAGGV